MGKKKSKKIDEAVAELEEVLKEEADEKIKRKPGKTYGRAPGAPTSRERRRIAALKKAKEAQEAELAKQLAVNETVLEDDDEVVMKNPRLASTPDAVQARRREAVWRSREAAGIPCRRRLLDREGNDIGATTAAKG
jgi:hypothetical protein